MNSTPLSVLQTLHLIYRQLAQVARLMCQVAPSFMSESCEMADKLLDEGLEHVNMGAICEPIALVNGCSSQLKRKQGATN